MRRGLIGLGTLGDPVARRFLGAVPQLLVWNRTAAKAEALRAAGATVAPSLDALFAGSDLVILLLSTEEAADAVLGRASDAFGRRVRGKLVCQMGTTSIPYSKSLAAEISAAGGRYVEAPVSGSRIPAERGELVVMIAGEGGDKAIVTEVLAPVAGRVFDCGVVPNALSMKLATNIVMGPLLSGLSEAAAFARAAGLDLATLEQILLGGQASSGILTAKLAKLRARDYRADASVLNAFESVGAAARAAADLGQEPVVLAACVRLLEAGMKAGLAEEDVIALEKVAGRRR